MEYCKKLYVVFLLLAIYIVSSFSNVEAKRQYKPLSPVGANELVANVGEDVRGAGVILTQPRYSQVADNICLLAGFNQDGCISIYTYNGLITNIQLQFDLENHAPAGSRSTMTDGMMILGAVLMELGAEGQDIHTGLTEPLERDVVRTRKDYFKKTYTVFSRKMKHNLEITVEADDLTNDISFDIWAFAK